MRIRLMLFFALLLWIAAESGFSPSYFWETVQSSVAAAARELNTALDPHLGAQPAAIASAKETAKETILLFPAQFETNIEPAANAPKMETP